jgi:PAS domain S-box-containing protein
MTTSGRVAVLDATPDGQRHADGLRDAGAFEVTRLDSVAAVTDAIAAGRVDCLVLRHRLPDRTGVELVRDIRTTRPDLPLILLADVESNDVLVDALHADVTDVVPADADDVHRLLAERVAIAIDAERDRVAASNNERIASVIRDVNRTLLWADTTDSLLWRTCRILSRGDPYVFAWVGLIDEATGALDPVAWGGIGEEYLDDITVTIADEATGQGPGGEAVRTGEVSVVHDVTSDSRFEPWRDRAEQHGYRSVAAIPLRHGDETYGVLGVYADRPVAFDDDEVEMLAAVGDDVGYAIDALETRAELERHADLVTHAPIGVYTTEPGPDGVIIEANPAMANILDADDVAEITGMRVEEFYVDPEERHRFLETLDPTHESTAQVRLRTLADREIVCRSTAVQVQQPTGETSVMGALHDVTNRLSLEADLSAEREFVEQLLEISPAAIIVFDTEGDVVRANAEAERILETTRSDLLNSHHDANPWEAIDENGHTIPPEERPFLRVLETGRSVMGLEYGIRFPDGRERWLSTNAVPLFDDGEVYRVVLVVDDLTEKHEHATALERERDRFRAIFEEAFDAIVLADDDGRYVAANPAAEELFGLPREALLGQGIKDFTGQEFDFDAAWSAFTANREERGIFELERPTGETRLVEYSATSDIIPGQHLSILRDITERIEYETQLREQNLRLETVLDNTPVVVFAYDDDGQYTFVAGQGLAETGVAADDIVGTNFNDVFADQPPARELLGRALDGTDINGDVRFGGRDFEVWARPTDSDAFPDTDDADVPAVIGVAMDVTDTRANAADARARQDQIAFFNSLLRHEVLNGLAVVLGNADLLQGELDDDGEFAEIVDRIRSRGNDIVDTVRRIRNVLEKLAVAEPSLAVRDLGSVTRNRLAQLRSDHPDAVITLDAPTSAPVYADELLGDVVYNVASNAIVHNDGETSTVDVSVTIGSDQTRLRVADDGPGIPDAVLDLLLDESNEERTWATAGSFGLYFVITMVQRYGGSIDVVDRDPDGTIVDIHLPTAPATDTEPTDAHRDTEPTDPLDT